MNGYQLPWWYPSVFGQSAAPLPGMQPTWQNAAGFNYQPGPSNVAIAPPAPAAPPAAAPPVSATQIDPTAAPSSGVVSPDQAYLNQLNSQMAPNPTLGYVNAGIQGIGVLGNLGLGIFSAMKANEAFQWQKNMAENNYWNSVKSYNTAMHDRVRTRYSKAEYAANKDAIDAEAEKNQLNGKG